MAEFNVPQSNTLLGVIPNANNFSLGSSGHREQVLGTASQSASYLQGVQERTVAKIGNRPDPDSSNDIEEVQYTLTNWTSNGAKLVQDAGAAFNQIANNPAEFFNSLKTKSEEAFNTVKGFAENTLKTMGLTPEQIAQGGVDLLKLPILAQAGAIELFGNVIADMDKLRKGEISFEQLKENFEKKQKSIIEKLAKQMPQLAQMLGGADEALKFAGSLLKSVSDSMGLTEVWDGISTGDFGKIGRGLGKFAAEATGWNSMVQAWDCLKKGDAGGFALNFTMGIGGMAMTASSVLTFGGSAAAFLGTKAVVKGAMTAVTREGMEVLAKETGEKITQTLANELKNVLVTQVPKEMAEKAPQEMLESVLKQSGQEMFAGFKQDLVANLKNPEFLKKFDLSDDVLDKLQKGTIDEVSKGKLDLLVKETSKEATLRRTNELIEKLNLAEKLPEVTDRVVTELLTDISSMSKKDLGKMFSGLLEKQGMAPKEAAKLGKEYAWRAKSALNGQKVDREIIELLTDSIHKEFTAPIRESFEASLKEGMPKILDELKVNASLREELTTRWSKAAMEGFEEGLQPIRKLIEEGVERAVKRHRHRDDDSAAVNPGLPQNFNKEDDIIVAGKKKSTKLNNDGKVISQSTTLENLPPDDDFWLKQAKSKEEALRLKREEREKAYLGAGSTTTNKPQTTLGGQAKSPGGQTPQSTETVQVENYRRELRPTPEELPSIFKS